MMRRAIVLGLSLCMIASCGWRLRGSVDLPEGLSSIYIKSENRDFARELTQLFQANGVVISDSSSASDLVIEVGELQQDRRVATTGADTLVTEYELSYQAPFSIKSAQGETLQETDTLYVSRAYEFNNDEVVSRSEEERVILREMRIDLAQQLVRRLRFLTTP
ncbi:hypothetical protein NBRC116494_09550 [Aurantivibrio plasticivorans]